MTDVTSQNPTVKNNLPSHTTFPPGGMVDEFDDLLCARCDGPATHSFGDDFHLCDICSDDFGRWLDAE